MRQKFFLIDKLENKMDRVWGRFVLITQTSTPVNKVMSKFLSIQFKMLGGFNQKI